MADLIRRLLHPIYRRLERCAQPLRYLFVEITQRCNLECRHCGSDCGREAQRPELSAAQWCEFFAYLPRHFDRREMVLVVTGGEPFCHPEFDRVLGGLSENGLTWGMVSNGWALTPANVAKVVDHGISSLTVSLDGLAPAHDWLRGRPGAFTRTVAGLRNVAAAGLPFFDVVTCVNPRNLAELPSVMALLVELGVPAWRLFTIFPTGRAKADPGLRLDDDQLRRLFAWIAEARRVAPRGLSLQYGCEGYLPARLDDAVRDEPYFCRAGISIGSVLCDGSISACPNISRDLIQGNVRSDDFATVWEERFVPFRRREWMKQGPCADCEQWRRCEGNSLHLWDPATASTALCHHRVLGGGGDCGAPRRD